MQKKTKIIIAVVVATVILIPIIIIAAAVVSIKSSGTTGSYNYNRSAQFASTTGSFDEMEIAAEPLADRNTGIMNDATAGTTAAEVDQKIIKTGYLELVVNSANEAATKISALAAGLGGYTQNTSISENTSGTKYGTVTVRLPTDVFENTMSEIKKIAVSVNTETSNAQDVTEEYTDLEARLKNAEAQEAEYLKILEKAVSVSDILNVQSYLGQIRSEIESLKGRIQYLENMTSYSTITVYLSEDPVIKLPSKEFQPWTDVKEAAQAVISVIQSLITTAIWLIVLGGGVLIPIAIVIWLIVKIVKKIRRGRQNKK